MAKLPNDHPTPVPPELPAEARPKLITARTAIRNLAPFAGGHFLAKQLLVDRLCDGEVSAYAHDRWFSKGEEIETAWHAGPPSDAKRKSKIPRWLLDRRAQVLSDSQGWDWRRGRFFITRGTNGARRIVLLSDVRFVLSDIHKLGDALNPKGSGGPLH